MKSKHEGIAKPYIVQDLCVYSPTNKLVARCPDKETANKVMRAMSSQAQAALNVRRGRKKNKESFVSMTVVASPGILQNAA